MRRTPGGPFAVALVAVCALWANGAANRVAPPSGVKAEGFVEHTVFLPSVSKQWPPVVTDLVELVDRHDLYDMRVNPNFSRQEWVQLLARYNKKKITFYWVDSREEVPWDSEHSRSEMIDGATGTLIHTMFQFDSDTQPTEVILYLFTNEAYYTQLAQQRGEDLLTIYPLALSGRLWRAIAAPNRDYLWGGPSPNPTDEEIQRYLTSPNTLILVSQ